MDYTFYCGDKVAGVLEPAVWVVDDAAVRVFLDFVTVDEPFQRGSAVDDIVMYTFSDTRPMHVLIDNECPFLNTLKRNRFIEEILPQILSSIILR